MVYGGITNDGSCFFRANPKSIYCFDAEQAKQKMISFALFGLYALAVSVFSLIYQRARIYDVCGNSLLLCDIKSRNRYCISLMLHYIQICLSFSVIYSLVLRIVYIRAPSSQGNILALFLGFFFFCTVWAGMHSNTYSVQ